MFGRIARRYDLANRLLSGGRDRGWRRSLVGRSGRAPPAAFWTWPRAAATWLSPCSRRLPAARILGMDFCEPMLAEARTKKGRAPVRGLRQRAFSAGDGPGPAPGRSLASMPSPSPSACGTCRTGRAPWPRSGGCCAPEAGSSSWSFPQPSRLVPAALFFLPPPHPAGRWPGWMTGDRAAYVYLNATDRGFPGREPPWPPRSAPPGLPRAPPRGSPAASSPCTRRAADPPGLRLNDLPQPQVEWALGLLISKPRPWRPSSKSMLVPRRCARARRIDDDRLALALAGLVPGLGLVEGHAVLHPGATARLHRKPQAFVARGQPGSAESCELASAARGVRVIMASG